MQINYDLVNKDYYLDIPLKVINSNQDLNNFTTPGIYRCSGDTAAATLINCPISHSFKLVVEMVDRAERYKQTLIDYYRNDTYVRIYKSGDWSAWQKLATADVTNALDARITALETFNTKRFVVKSYSYKNVTDTGINVNGDNAGKAAFIIISANYAAGDSTGAGLYLIRFGYNGNHYTATTLHENNMITQIRPVWSITSNNTLGVTCTASGNCNLLAIIVD